MTSKEEFLSEIETDSHRYGNEKTIEDAFENPFNPHPPDLEKALADTAHLTEKEAFAFVQGRFLGFPGVTDEQMADETVQEWGFESYAEFRTVRATARKKIAEAIWIYELIDAYRFPLPDECSTCGKAIEGTQFETDDSEGEVIVICSTCADEEPGDEQIKQQRIAVVDEVEDLLEEIEAKTGKRPGRVLQNINLARADLLNDGEFNYCVRLALIQLEQVAEKAEDGATELRGEINALREQLPEKAALPPKEQISR